MRVEEAHPKMRIKYGIVDGYDRHISIIDRSMSAYGTTTATALYCLSVCINRLSIDWQDSADEASCASPNDESDEDDWVAETKKPVLEVQ